MSGCVPLPRRAPGWRWTILRRLPRRGKDPLTTLNIKALREEIAHYSDLGTRVIEQARRRVLEPNDPDAAAKQATIPQPFHFVPVIARAMFDRLRWA
jgi:hypothetical protein